MASSSVPAARATGRAAMAEGGAMRRRRARALATTTTGRADCNAQAASIRCAITRASGFLGAKGTSARSGKRSTRSSPT